MTYELWAIKNTEGELEPDTLSIHDYHAWEKYTNDRDRYEAEGCRAVRVRLVEDGEPSGNTGELREWVKGLKPPMTMREAQRAFMPSAGCYTEEQLAAWEQCRDAVLELLDEAHGADGGERRINA